MEAHQAVQILVAFWFYCIFSISETGIILYKASFNQCPLSEVILYFYCLNCLPCVSFRSPQSESVDVLWNPSNYYIVTKKETKCVFTACPSELFSFFSTKGRAPNRSPHPHQFNMFFFLLFLSWTYKLHCQEGGLQWALIFQWWGTNLGAWQHTNPSRQTKTQ